MPLQIVQIGMGNWGRGWAQNILSRNKDVALVACVDNEPAMLAKIQNDLSIPAERCFTTLEAALEFVEADAVLITASLSAHIPMALAALRAGKHVLLEKPFAATLEEARTAVAVAAECKRVLMVSQNYRFFPAVRAVTALIREEALGPVGTVNIDFRRYRNPVLHGHTIHFQRWQPLLADMAIHHFDLMRLVLGQEPCQVMCQTWNPPWSSFVDPAAATATITFSGGAVVNYRGSWISPGPQTPWSGEWRLECAGGEIVWASRDDKGADYVTLRALGKRSRHLKLPEVPLTDRHGSLNAFVQAIQKGQEPECSGRDNLQTLALMLATIDSSTSGLPLSPGS